MKDSNRAVLSCQGQYTKFKHNGIEITFLHGKDLLRYLDIKKWDDGYLVVDCLGKVKGKYEDYIDLNYILENLYMDAKAYLRDVEGVILEDV